MKKNIVLTGFMGTGKSTVGRIVAERLGYGFVDTDDVIEAEAGRSISDIFRESGESVFRQLEMDVAQVLAGKTGLVIATGGRLMLNPENADALGRNGHVFCLMADPEVLAMRLLQEGGKRPLLDVPNPAERINALLQERAAGYGRFQQIETTNRFPNEVADEIIALVR
ncbi:MAG: shikimate kinase [Chloroflexi bacterium]|nr:shikimate kinase [Chloroflexota bacterium]